MPGAGVTAGSLRNTAERHACHLSPVGNWRRLYGEGAIGLVVRRRRCRKPHPESRHSQSPSHWLKTLAL
jgi:hypothetical protein